WCADIANLDRAHILHRTGHDDQLQTGASAPVVHVAVNISTLARRPGLDVFRIDHHEHAYDAAIIQVTQDMSINRGNAAAINLLRPRLFSHVPQAHADNLDP